MDVPTTIDVTDFETEVVSMSYEQPVLVDFWAPWCQPCLILSPILEQLATEANGQWTLAKVNVDDYPQLSAEKGVRGIPHVVLYKEGEEVDGFAGAMPKHELKKWLMQHLPSPGTVQAMEAEALAKEGKVDAAKTMLEDILMKDPTNVLAKVILSQILLFTNAQYALETLPKLFEGDEHYDQVATLGTLAQLLVLQQTPQFLEEAPVKATYLEALNALAQQDFKTALEKFIEVIRENKQYENEGARLACIAIFNYLGPAHGTTIAYRKQFDMALY